MGLGRDDRWVTDAQGRALAGALVYWLNQPANTTVTPPTPAASIFTDSTGSTPEANPQSTDGFGHAYAYMDDSVAYTVYVSHPLFGPNPVILPDQSVGTGGVGYHTFAGSLQGTIDGTNTVFVVTNGGTPLTTLPAQIMVWDNFPLIQGTGYTVALSGGQLQVTFTTAPQVGDTLYAQGLY